MFKLLTEQEQIDFIRKNEIKNEQLLKVFLESPSWKIRNELTNQKYLTKEMKEKLLNDEHYIVVESSLNNFQKEINFY
jgi:hypothetical protein